jgi:hypothetical protein
VSFILQLNALKKSLEWKIFSYSQRLIDVTRYNCQFDFDNVDGTLQFLSVGMVHCCAFIHPAL